METKCISSCLWAMLVMLLVGVSGCTEEKNAYLEAIPTDVETVVAIDLKSIAQKAEFEKHPTLTQVMQELGNTFLPAEEASAMSLFQTILQSPKECGIDLSAPLYIFNGSSKTKGKIGLVAQITDREKALKWIEPLSVITLCADEQPQGQRFCDLNAFKQLQQLKADIAFFTQNAVQSQSIQVFSACHFEKGKMSISLQMKPKQLQSRSLKGKFLDFLPASTCAVASFNIDFQSLLSQPFYADMLKRWLGDQSETVQELLMMVNGETTLAVTESTGQLIPSMVLYTELAPTVNDQDITEHLSDLGIPPIFYKLQQKKLVISNEINRLHRPWQKVSQPLTGEMLGKNTSGKQIYAGIDAAKLVGDKNWSLLINPESLQILNHLKLLELSMEQPDKITLTLHTNETNRNILLTLIETFEAIN